MAKSFNFNKVPRKYFSTTLKNGKTYLVAMPKKDTFEALYEIKQVDAEDRDAVESIYETVAQIVSNNKQGYKVTTEDLKDYDFDEIKQYLEAYTDFVKGLPEEKK